MVTRGVEDGHAGDVVVEVAVAVAHEGLVKGPQERGGGVGCGVRRPRGEGEEVAVGVAGFGDAVGVEQQQVAAGEGDPVDVVLAADERGEVDRRRGRRGLDGQGGAVADEEGRRVPAAEDRDVRAGRRELDDDDRGEALRGVLGGDGDVVPGECGVQAVCELRQVGGLVGGFVEGTEDGGGDADGAQTLAADVSEDEAQAMRGVGGGVEVAADTACGAAAR